MGRTRDGRARINWPFVRSGIATIGLSGGIALAIGAVASELGHPFGKVMLLFALLGGLLVFLYSAVLSSVVTPRMEHKVRKLGGLPTMGRAGETEKTVGFVMPLSFLVFFVGLGFLIVGILGVAL